LKKRSSLFEREKKRKTENTIPEKDRGKSHSAMKGKEKSNYARRKKGRFTGEKTYFPERKEDVNSPFKSVKGKENLPNLC